MTKFFLLDIIKRRADVAIRPDVSLTILGGLLPPPKWWLFGGVDEFNALFGYGDFEIEFWSVNGRIEIRRIGIIFWEALHGWPEIKKVPPKLCDGVEVDFGKIQPGQSVSDIVNLMESNGLDYKVCNVDNASEVKFKVTTENKSEFIFFEIDGRISLSEIQIFSEKIGS